jgi:diguanylate cyclase (GGDEF)-like protein
MSLQRRLTLLFTLILILPLAAAGFIVQRAVVEEIERRALLSLEPALDIAGVVYNDRIESMRQQVAAASASPRLATLVDERRGDALETFLRSRLQPQGLDFLIVVNERGRTVAAALGDSEYVEGFEPPGPREIIGAPVPVGSGVARSAPLRIGGRGRALSGEIVGGFWIDEDVLVGDTDDRVELAVAVNREVVASTEPIERPTSVALTPRGRFEVDIDGRGTAEAQRIGPDTALVAWVPAYPLRAVVNSVVGSLVVLLALVLVAIAVLAYLMARLITKPLQELSAGAQAISEGRFDHRIPVRSKNEIGEVAAAFNDMSQTLDETITELSSSRAQLQRAVQTVAKTFRSTHNMEEILESLLDTAIDAVQADAAVLWRFSPTRRELYPAIVRGVDHDFGDVPVGSGMVGLVAERGAPTLTGPIDDDPRAPDLPFPVAIASPFYSQDRIQGVIALFRRDPNRAFRRQDLNTAVFLAEQGSVAIENVTLHEEAQRLSLTDGLTGVWNRRYFQMQFRQVLATSVRFQRPFSLLMMDLDNFKVVNDTLGHQRGDATLVEFSQRVNRVLREVDTFARYGGEEFICLLPETDFSGASTTAEKVLDVIKSEPFGESAEEPVRLTVSIGVASYPTHGSSLSAIVEAADQALYRAKEQGRDRVVVAGDQPPNLTIAR